MRTLCESSSELRSKGGGRAAEGDSQSDRGAGYCVAHVAQMGSSPLAPRTSSTCGGGWAAGSSTLVSDMAGGVGECEKEKVEAEGGARRCRSETNSDDIGSGATLTTCRSKLDRPIVHLRCAAQKTSHSHCPPIKREVLLLTHRMH